MLPAANVPRPIFAAAVLVAALTGAGAPAAAGPFAEVGDRQIRQDVDLLKAEGLILGPVDSWPLPWAQINGGLDAARDGRVLDPAISAAVDRLERLSDLAAQRTSVDSRLSATNGSAIARDFGTAARANVDASVKVELNLGALSLSPGIGARTGGSGNRLNYDPSTAALTIGNYAIYAGYTEQWWGPGHDGALMYSNSARPFPRIGIKKLVPNPIDLPVARLFGPIRIEFFIGFLDDKRDFRNSWNVGTRISMQPGRGVEIGFNRAQQLCGNGRPCGFSQIANSFVGLGNSDNPTSGSLHDYIYQPGNQIAGYDASYTRRFGRVVGKFYFEVAAEDFQHILIEQYGRMIGTAWSGPWGRRGASWQATVEYSDTLAAQLFKGTPLEKITGSERVYPGSLYNSGLYLDGFSYRGRPIGYWIGGDSRNLVAALAVTDRSNRRWYGSARSVHLNLTGIAGQAVGPFGIYAGYVGNRISTNSEKFAIATAGAEVPTRFGDIGFEVRYQSDSPGTPGRREGRVQAEISIRERF